uniref:FA complementation group B n=1 Tax=Fundulus heteroclitus TaxID=8078 RepID=A0A3Q2PZX7_FUNHE
MEKSSSEDSRRNAHSLSHGGKVVLFTCKPDPGADGSERSGLTFRTFYFEREGNAFVKATEGAAAISRKLAARMDVVTCESALDVQRRVKTPFVLVTKRSEKGGSFQYSLLTLAGSPNRLEPCIEFKLPYQMKGKVRILQGPTVLWCHGNSAFYTSPLAAGVREVPVQTTRWLFGELPIHKGQLFALGLSEPLLTNQPQSTLGYFLELGQVFDGSLILPRPYLCITQCVRVLRADGEGDALRCAVVAATSQKQLVLFENGTVRDTCELPFEQADDVQVVNTGRSGCLLLVLFKQGHVCAVWKETFQIACCWSEVSSAHVGDFLGCGTEQALLLFGGPGFSREPLEKFLITDLCGISYSSGQDSEAPKTSLPPQENSLFTLQALESRLQSGLNVLQELEREVRVKDRVLQQSIQVLAEMLSGREAVLSQPEQEGLVALWDSDEGSDGETLDDKMHETPATSSKPKADKLWHRITGDQLVVGLILSAESGLPASGVSLSLLTEPGQSSPAVIQSRSQVFWLPARGPPTPTLPASSSGRAFSEPAAKRSKRRVAGDDPEARRLAVTAATELAPLLTSGCVKCRAMLHYAEEGEALVPESRPATAVQHCGNVSVDVHDLCQTPLLQNPQIRSDEVREDLLSLLTVLDHWLFRIDSPDYSLGDVDGWIKRREGFKKIEVSPEHLLLDSPGCSAPMLLRWHQINPFQGNLSIHSSQLQMLQFLDSMLTYLPDSCSIQPVKCTTRQSTAEDFASALEKEVLSLREGLSSLLCGKEEEESNKGRTGHEEIQGPGSAEELIRCRREAWQQNVEKSRVRLSPLVDAGRYREMIKSISKVKMDADLAALQQAQMTGQLRC